MLAEIKHVQAPVAAACEDRQRQRLRNRQHRADQFHSPAAFQVNGCRVEINKGPGKIMDHRFCRRHDRPGQKRSARRRPHRRHARWHRPEQIRKGNPRPLLSTPESAKAISPPWPPAWPRAGMRPFAAIYSTFLQRAFDQVWQEVALNHLPVASAWIAPVSSATTAPSITASWTRPSSARCPASS